MDYLSARSWLFRLDPELSHHLTLSALKLTATLHLLKPLLPTPRFLPTKNVLGLSFKNSVGLAAGLDKNGDYIDALGELGFGFIEIGTVTPKPQLGNPKPRLFRLPAEQAVINRMGFNNKGVDYLVSRVSRKKYLGILGINIGKNASTAIENAVDDYIECMTKVYPYASYITVNISSPNTPELRKLQGDQYLSELVRQLKETQLKLASEHNQYVPLLIKVAPDLTDSQIEHMGQILVANKIDGIIATNTTTDRDLVQGSKHGQEAGGLSGAPLFKKSTEVLRKIKLSLGSAAIPIIASGGIMSAEDAKEKIAAGADLIQLYTGLIYSGPGLINQCITVCDVNQA